MTEQVHTFPRQKLPFTKKTKEWRKSCVKYGAYKNIFTYSPIRQDVRHKMINYNLINGKLNMQDLELIVNPDGQTASYIPDKIQHYPIMNTKLDVLDGEEAKRIFDYRVIITNPEAITEIEEEKRNLLIQKLTELAQSGSQSDEEIEAKLQKIQKDYSHNMKSLREIRANYLINHYSKQYNFKALFNDGFKDAKICGEELYQCDIVGGEPVIERLDPRNVYIYQSGYSKHVEDADLIVIEDYWSPGRIYDTYYDILTKKDMDYIEKLAAGNVVESTENEDPRVGLIPTSYFDINNTPSITDLFPEKEDELITPFDFTGNIRVCRVYWKSRKLVKKVKSYNLYTGETEYNFYPEDYIPNKDKGEEVENIWINEAWEGTQIGEKIFINMRPRPIQYNTLSNPSRCHFGIIGTIYNINNDKPFSLVDRMKPYNYYYDVAMDRLNKLCARNYGKIIDLDLATVPDKWPIDKWMYFLKTNGIRVRDSFKEGNKGAATGKLAGAMNNASSGIVDAELGQSIMSLMNLIQFTENEMSTVAGISKQREGQISNRETVGGVERATLQSSHITEWLFLTHDDTKKRAIECFLETAKIAIRGKNKKFQYILPDSSIQIINIDGDEFSECDYGLVVDNEEGLQRLQQNIETLAQAALQNQNIRLSTLLKIYRSSSLAEKAKLIEDDENEIIQQRSQEQQQVIQAQQEKNNLDMQLKQAELEQNDIINQRDNETKILIATMKSQQDSTEVERDNNNEDIAIKREQLNEKVREFDEMLAFNKEKQRQDISIKEKQLSNNRNKENK